MRGIPGRISLDWVAGWRGIRIKEHVEAQLVHKEAGVSGIYNQAQYLPQRRAMMQWYADYLDGLADGMTPVLRAEFDRRVNVTEDNVVEIKRMSNRSRWMSSSRACD